MKKIMVNILIFLLALCFVGCATNTAGSKNNTSEQVAATNLESWVKSDFETYLHTYPTFRLRNRALSFAGDRNADLKKVAEAMSEYFDGAEPRDIEILNTRIIEQHEITDNSIYVKLQEKYDDITKEELKEITEIATIMVGYMFEGEVRETEIECIKMNNTWFVLRDVAFTS